MGKITVIKHFAVPKLIYALLSLQYPPKEIIKDIEKIMYAFTGKENQKRQKGKY